VEDECLTPADRNTFGPHGQFCACAFPRDDEDDDEAPRSCGRPCTGCPKCDDDLAEGWRLFLEGKTVESLELQIARAESMDYPTEIIAHWRRGVDRYKERAARKTQKKTQETHAASGVKQEVSMQKKTNKSAERPKVPDLDAKIREMRARRGWKPLSEIKAEMLRALKCRGEN
jgi:hypothetical protein